MTLETYKKLKEQYNKTLDELTVKLNSFKKSGGVIIDSERKTPEFMQLKKTYDFTFKQYQNFNSLKESKAFAKQLFTEKRNSLTKK